MREIFSAQRKFLCWRKIWLALAETQHELGLPISKEQIAGLREHLEPIDFAAAAEHERRMRHSTPILSDFRYVRLYDIKPPGYGPLGMLRVQVAQGAIA